MNRFLLLLLPIFAIAGQITLDHVKMMPLGKIIKTNAQITQLSDQKQEVVSRLAGHIEEYYVKPGEQLKAGDKIALIESMELSKMTADYLSFAQQTKATNVQLNSSKKLFKKGLNSKNELNSFIIATQEIAAKKNALASQLRSLGIKPKSITTTTDKFMLYAHADGVVGKILMPLHSNVDAQTSLMTLVNQSAYYATAYLSVNDAMLISKNTIGNIDIAGSNYQSHFIQLLPQIDETTQRAQVLFQIEKSPKNMLLGAFTEMEISIEPYENVLMVKKSALTLFQGEWVIFVENHHDEHEEDAKHEEKKEESHKDDEHDDEGEHNDEEESPYSPKVVKIITYTGDYVAIEGLKADEEYVSNGVYFVKSMLLKSSLGGHGH